MAFLQAFTDDSASIDGDERLFLAGYLATADRWIRFSELWDAELRAEPSIEFFKMNEAVRCAGQFQGWSASARDAKVERLAAIIQATAPFSFEISVSGRSHREIVKPASPRGLAAPHFACTFGVVSSVSRYVHSLGIRLPIDFIFDQQDGVSADMTLFFDYMKKDIPAGARALVNGNPIFGDDRDFLPLQAADMLVWHVRREHELDGPALPMAGRLRNPEGHLEQHIETAHLESWARGFEKLPGVHLTQSRPQWRALRKEIQRVIALGYIPPHGTRWRNAVQKIRAWLRLPAR